MPAPGATTSGLVRPSSVAVGANAVRVGPRLENESTRRSELTAPTVSTSGYGDGGSSTEEHDGPVFPAAATKKMPAARNAAVAGSRAVAAPPSIPRQPPGV